MRPSTAGRAWVPQLSEHESVRQNRNSSGSWMRQTRLERSRQAFEAGVCTKLYFLSTVPKLEAEAIAVKSDLTTAVGWSLPAGIGSAAL